MTSAVLPLILGSSRLLQMQRDDGGFALWDKMALKSTG